MSRLLKRNEPQASVGSTGIEFTEHVGSIGELIREDNPLSPHFVPRCGSDLPCGDAPKSIVFYMLALQRKQYGSTISDHNFDVRVLVRNCKLLLQDYDPDIVKRAVRYATMTSRYPFSFKYVRKLIPDMLERMGDV